MDFFKDKKILVTGGTGFVGIHIVQELLKRGALLRVPIHNRELPIKHKNIETINADLINKKDCIDVCRGIDYVINASGKVVSAGAQKHQSSIMDAITTDLILTAQMLEAAWITGVKRFLLLSSGATTYPLADYPMKEEEKWNGEPPQPYYGYGWMRRYLEKLGEFVHSKSDMKVAITHPVAVYGPWDISSHVIPSLIKKALERQNPYEVWGSGGEIRDFTYVTDYVHGSLLALEKHATADPINISSGKASSIKDVVGIILKHTNYQDANVIYNNSKPTTVPIRLLDISKAEKIFNYKPHISLEDGIKSTIEWQKKNESIS